jgi:hypothetical protein
MDILHYHHHWTPPPTTSNEKCLKQSIQASCVALTLLPWLVVQWLTMFTLVCWHIGHMIFADCFHELGWNCLRLKLLWSVYAVFISALELQTDRNIKLTILLHLFVQGLKFFSAAFIPEILPHFLNGPWLAWWTYYLICAKADNWTILCI